VKLLDIFRKKEPEPKPDGPEIKTIHLTMAPGTVKTFRLFNDTDRTKDRTLVVYAGQLDSRKLRDVERVIAGTHTAHRRPSVEVEG
jgi:hypothetical protein